MSSKRSFWKAVHSLAHPISIAAILLLLINDHWLRIHHPSWLTGKLGDFTWLVFAPFIAAMLFAWIVPRRTRQHERIVGILSFAFIGIWFATAKTIPLIHQWTTDAVEAIIGWEGTLRMDTTDLLTLPALLIGWWVWQRADATAISLRPLAYIALALGLLGTLATSPPQYVMYGVSRVCHYEDFLVATEGRVSNYDDTSDDLYWSSIDGGIMWRSIADVDVASVNCPDETNLLIDPNNEQVQYRWVVGERIERSIDGGQIWNIDYDLIELRQDVRSYNSKAKKSSSLSPLDGIIDPITGNIVFAMGWNGILVRTVEGQYEWIAVGGYNLDDLGDTDKISSVLSFEFWLAGVLAFLIVSSSTVYARQNTVKIRKNLLFLGWVGWAFLMVFLAFDQNGYWNTRNILLVFSLPLLLFVAIPLSLNAVWDMTRNYRYVWKHVGLVAIGNGLMFILPFFLWSQGTIPLYRTAHLFSLMTAGLAMYAGYVYLRPRLPILEPDKHKREVKKTTEAE